MTRQLTSWQKFVKKNYGSVGGKTHKTIMKRLSKMYKQRKTRKTIRQREPTNGRLTSSRRIFENGATEYVNSAGQRHNMTGPAFFSEPEGFAWYIMDLAQRSDGPQHYENGYASWMYRDKLHRLDGPADEFMESEENNYWYINGLEVTEVEYDSMVNGVPETDDLGNVRYKTDEGKLSRLDGPAIEWANGDKEWYIYDYRHRRDGPAVEKADGTKEWFLNGGYHRRDGPAVEKADGTKEWLIENYRHRLDGPAVEKADGTKEWWLDGLQVTEEEFNRLRANFINQPLREFGEEYCMPKLRENENKVSWLKIDNSLHRENGPAVLLFYEDDYYEMKRTKIEEWWVDGRRYRPDGLPCIVEYDNNIEGTILSQEWSITNGTNRGLYGRKYNQGNMTDEKFENEDRQEVSREEFEELFGNDWRAGIVEQPSGRNLWNLAQNVIENNEDFQMIEFYDNSGTGRVKSIRWSKEDPELPTQIKFSDDFWPFVQEEEWNVKVDGERDIGIVVISYEPNGSIKNRKCIKDGVPMPMYEWQDIYGNPTLASMKRAPLFSNTISAVRFPLFESNILAYANSMENIDVQDAQEQNETDEETDQVCPREDINYIRQPGPGKDIAKCKTIFTVNRQGGYPDGYPMGNILDKLYRECNFTEDAPIDSSYLNTTVKYLQRKYKITSQIDLTTEEGKEVVSALKIKDSLSQFIPQATTGSTMLKVRYLKQFGIDYGGLSRQFISSIMDKISSVLFDRIEMESEPYNDIVEGMSDAEKKKALIEGSRPRYFITKKNNEDIFKQIGFFDQTLGDRINNIIEELKTNVSTNELFTTLMTELKHFSSHYSSSINLISELEQIQKNIREDINSESNLRDIDAIFELAGRMFAYAAINKIPFNIPLSRLLLKKMLNGNQDVSEEEKLAAYVLDTGKSLSKDINLRFEIDANEEEIKDYLNDLESTLKKSMNEAYNVDNSRLENFIRGFSSVGDILKRRNFTLNELNALICKTEITKEDIEKLLDRVDFQGFEIHPELIPIVKNAILAIPEYAQSITDEDEQYLKSTDYSNLLKWWTGSSVIIDDEDYSVVLVTGGSSRYNFNSHTCFFQMDINISIIQSPDFQIELIREIQNIKYTSA